MRTASRRVPSRISSSLALLPALLPATAAAFQPLEPRRMMAVTFAIDGDADVRPISRYVYGINEPLEGAYSRATSRRAGGNRWTAYNWENNASNAGSDYFFQNDNFLGGGETPGGATASYINNAAARNAAAILTVPMAGYVSADKNGGGDVRNSGANYLSTRFNQIRPRKGAPFALTPDLTDDFVYADEFVNWAKQTYGYSQTDPNRPIWFSLDNEPDLWSNTHAEVHPNPVTYAELIAKTIDYSKAIKDAMPNTKVFGAVNYGFAGYVSLQGAPDAAGRNFLDTFLAQLKTASQADGRRLLDVLDLHWYPEARGGGVRITEQDSSPAVVAARLQAPRSLWDASYRETSWIANDYYNGPINLLPRLKQQIATRYAGTGLGFTEYNYGGGAHISGGIAQADVLGIFGRDGVFAANQWKLHADESFVGGAFQMFRNYDRNGAAFGDTSIRATTSDVAGSSVYAARDSSDPNVLTIVAINKTANALPANVALSDLNVAAGAQANVFHLTSASATPQAAGNVIVNGNAFTYAMPAYSVSTIRVPLSVAAPAPTTQATSFNYESAPNTLTFRFDQDVAASLGVGDLTVTRGGTTITPTGVTYDAATNTATFTLPTPLADGDYAATLTAAGVTNAAGTALAANAVVPFFVLAADADHDRDVDFSDLLVLADNYGQSGRTFSQGNFDYSAGGDVGFDDLLSLGQRYGTSLVVTGVGSSDAGRPTRARDRVALDVIR